ncbi:hypothetical protein PVK06_048951 [Gossypium arboreum]|uniref:Reverse transcriptase domain-containing protein n=1 Tax=Gossypium arboreum TaxID=29729 RepID=A0ABR0MHN2_GOSAR|nr:hypothetical protein PVK06_048951 [Gossypium arboreum]
MAFDPSQTFPSVVMAWIRFLTLPSYLYNHKIIIEIGNLVGKMVKLDINTDSRTRGRFARLAVYGHVESICNFKVAEAPIEANIGSLVEEPVNQNLNIETTEKKDGNYGPWMIVERKSRRKSRIEMQKSYENLKREKESSNLRDNSLIQAWIPLDRKMQAAENLTKGSNLGADGSGGRPFRFLVGWTYYSTFPTFVKEKWKYSGNMSDSLNNFTSDIKIWNRNVYGFLNSRKRTFLRSLNNIQKAIDHSPSSLLSQKELEVRDELENVLDHEDLFWRQKVILQEKAVDYFKRLYGEITPTLMEIKKALFDMAPLKAPGSDGYHAIFFQSQWDLLGGDVCQWVKEVFVGRQVEKDLNNMLIVLIPKKENPEDFSQFRPISLCSVLYKLVMKVIANRFKVIFPKLISQEQAGFIAERNISDNIILTQEIIHSMRCKQKARNWMALKLDLEKAYDRVSWEFIEASLSATRIPIYLRKVILSVISSSTMQIL